jgi:nucleotide-binding universal stress UspA family protein
LDFLMPLKSILVPLRGYDHETEVIRSALRLGRAEGAHVRYLVARPSIETLGLAADRQGVGCSEPMLREAEAAARRAEHRIRWAVQGAVVEFDAPMIGPGERAAPGFACAIATVDELIADAAAREAPYHDLTLYEPDRGPLRDVLLSAYAPDDPVVDAVLRRAGRPILLACRFMRDRLPRSVALACDGGASAARAAAAALPLLRHAQTRQVIRIGTAPGRERDPLRDYLHHHGIDAASEHLDPAGKAIGAALVTAMLELNFELLVMGAGASVRGHGTASLIARHVLRYATFPVLLTS